jgi:predicted hydrolase (HD superfamily)
MAENLAAGYIPNRDEAWKLLSEYNSEEFHLRHARTVEAVMRHFSAEMGHSAEEIEFWGVIGILHDIDFERWPDQHCIKAREILEERGIHPDIVHAVVSHAHGIMVDLPPEHAMEKVLFATDELTGLISAVAIMRPSRSLSDLETKSVMKKFKTPSFAAGCSRDVIRDGAERMGVSVEELVTRTLAGMRAVAAEIGLAGDGPT